MITSVRFGLSYDHLYAILSPSKFVYFNENLHCCNRQRHDVTCSRRKCYLTCGHNIIYDNDKKEYHVVNSTLLYVWVIWYEKF